MNHLECCYVVSTLFVLVLPGLSNEQLNFQTLTFTEEAIEVEWQDDFCYNLLAETYSESILQNQEAEINTDAIFSINLTEETRAIPKGVLFNDNERTFLRLTALNLNGSICSSSQSQNILYRFASETKLEVSVGSVAVIPVPDTHCEIPAVVWSNMAPDGRNCYCLPIQDRHYSFSNCIQYCGTEYNVSLLTINTTSRSVVFQNLDRIIDPFFLVHFLCDEHECDQDSCFIVSTISTYQIMMEDNSLLIEESTAMNSSSTTAMIHTKVELSAFLPTVVVVVVVLPILLIIIFMLVAFLILTRWRRLHSYKTYAIRTVYVKNT